MHSVEILLGLLAALAVLATFAAKIGVPSPIVQVLGGAALGFLPGLPRIEVAPDIIFLLFLPPLIYASAFFSSLRDIRANAQPIALLAIGLVLATMVVVAAAAHAAIPSLPWPAAFVLGAVVAPPDAVAVSAIAARLDLPRRIVTILEGESLVNDPTALVAYRMAVGAAVTGSFSVESAGLQLLDAAIGGVVIGLAVGWLAVLLRGRAEDPPVHMTVSILTPFAAYLSAEALGISGVLAVVTTGLYVGWMSPMVDSPNVRVQTRAVWNSLLFLLNGILFIMLGLQGRDILSHLSRWSPVTLLGLALLVCLTVLVVRVIWVFLFNTSLPRALSRRLRERDPYPPWQKTAIIAWAGLRGTDSMAAALAIPFATASGAPFPYRSLILFLAFCVILATLVLQGLSLPPLIRWLGLPRDESAEREEVKARLMAARAALARLDELAAEGDVSPEWIERLRSKYEHRLAHLKAQYGGTDDGSSPEHLAPHQRVRLELIEAERRAVIGLRNRGEISDDVLRRIERDIDLEELRLEA